MRKTIEAIEARLQADLTKASAAGDYKEASVIIGKIAEMKERYRILEEIHKSPIYQEEGKWRSRVKMPDGKTKRFTRKTREELLEALLEHYELTILAPTFRQLFDVWIENKARFLKKDTVSKYKRTFKRCFAKDEFADLKVKDITKYDIWKYCKRVIQEKQLPVKAYSDVKIILRGVLDDAEVNGQTQVSVEDALRTLRIDQKAFAKPGAKRKVNTGGPFTTDELQRMKAVAMDNPDNIKYWGLYLLSQLGIRIGELVALKNENVHLDESYLEINATEISYDIEDEENPEKLHRIFEIQEDAKTESGLRDVVLSEEAKETIRKIRAINPDGEYLLMGKNGWFKTKKMRETLAEFCEKAGVEYRPPKTMRSTCSSRMKNAGVPDLVIRQQMGWSTMQSAEPYLKDCMTIAEKKKHIDCAINY